MARYIDADKLLEELQEEIEFESSMYTEEQNKWFNIGLKCAVRDVKHQPTADVAEVKHGEWLLKYIGVGHYWECSECEYMECTKPRTNYCPECGALMDGGKAE